MTVKIPEFITVHLRQTGYCSGAMTVGFGHKFPSFFLSGWLYFRLVQMLVVRNLDRVSISVRSISMDCDSARSIVIKGRVSTDWRSSESGCKQTFFEVVRSLLAYISYLAVSCVLPSALFRILAVSLSLTNPTNIQKKLNILQDEIDNKVESPISWGGLIPQGQVRAHHPTFNSTLKGPQTTKRFISQPFEQ